MKRRAAAWILVGLLAASHAAAQTVSVEPATGPKTLAATMNVYVFPTAGQDASQQSQDEAECYSWAVQNVGTDPFELQKNAEQQKQQTARAEQQVAAAGQGAGARGAVGGAAAGALIGEIASDDAGAGAAYGAAAGAVVARRRTKRAQEQATYELEQESRQAAQATAAQMDNFKKAFSVCLEAKDYLVKY